MTHWYNFRSRQHTLGLLQPQQLLCACRSSCCQWSRLQARNLQLSAGNTYISLALTTSCCCRCCTP